MIDQALTTGKYSWKIKFSKNIPYALGVCENYTALNALSTRGSNVWGY